MRNVLARERHHAHSVQILGGHPGRFSSYFPDMVAGFTGCARSSNTDMLLSVISLSPVALLMSGGTFARGTIEAALT